MMTTSGVPGQFRVVVLLLALMFVGSSFPGVAQEGENQLISNQSEIVNIEAAKFVDPEDGGTSGAIQDSSGRLTIYRTEEKQGAQNYVVQVVPLNAGRAADVLEFVKRIVEPEEGNAKALLYVDPDTGERSEYIQVVTTENQMPFVVEAIQNLDLKEIKAIGGFPSYDIRMRYRLASELVPVLSNATTATEISADDLTNTIHFEHRASKIDEMLSLISFYDVPPLQIQFDVQLIEVLETNAEQLGLDWDAWKQSVGGEFQIGGNTVGSNSSRTRIDWLFTLDGTVLANFLNYTTRTGSAEIRRRAKLSANNLTPAVISSVSNVNLYDYVPVDEERVVLEEGVTKPVKDDERIILTPVPNRFRLQKVEADEVGMIITILPEIGTDLVTANVGVSSRNISAYDRKGNPIFLTQEFESKITLQNRVPLHVGTLETTDFKEERRGIPLLQDIPVLKYLFSVERRQSTNGRLFVIVTPVYSDFITYKARSMDVGGAVLEVNEIDTPEFLKREMLPLDFPESDWEGSEEGVPEMMEEEN